MRYKNLVLLLLILNLFLCSCGQEKPPQQVRFYYCNKNIDYGFSSNTIGYEPCGDPLDHSAYDKYFSNYLSGPKTNALISPFPAGTTLVSFFVEQQTANIVLNDEFSILTGIELSLACACISLTVQDMTGCATVEISAQNALLDNQESIIINTNTIHLNDQIHP